MTPLAGWENFYVIAGSSAAALIGLQFVVITLLASMSVARNQEQATAFATPTVVHFAAVLLLAGVQTAPWHGIGAIAFIWAFVGLGGIMYEIIVARSMRVQTIYKPVFEDWLFHFLLPLAAYATITVSALFASSTAAKALFGTGAGVLLLLFIGIHNAWDAVTYHVFSKKQGSKS